jgi:5-methylcytosine-specific restriction endonuclease McrA
MASHGKARACYSGHRPASGICDECRAAQSARYKHWRESNLAHNAERMRRYRVGRERTDREREVQARLNRQRQERLRSAESDGHSRQDVFDRDAGICQLCGVELDPGRWHQDHIVPLIAGGSDLIENCQALCPPCNWHKGVRTVEATV